MKLLIELLVQRHHLPRLFQIELSRRRGHHLTAHLMEELHIQRGLQIMEKKTQRRLRDIELLCGAGQVSRIRDGDHIALFLELHRCCPPF